MRLALTLGAAAVALTTMAASAQQNEEHRIVIRHGGHVAMDTNGDGWMSRDESRAGADRLFDELDSNDDGRLTSEDRPHFEHDVTVHVGPGAAPQAHGDNCTRTESGEGNERRITVICRSPDGSSSSEDRQVIIRRGGGGGEWVERDGDRIAPIPPVPPVPPVPPAPMFMMMLGDESEADLNGDGALSREEFRAQHLRLFDAHDANGDGRIRAPAPPAPPQPPVAPAAPEPPRRH